MTPRLSIPFGRRAGRAFSLLELLVVIGIIGLLAALAMPAIKNLRGDSLMNAASRQLLDDLGYARLKAISERTTVFVVFVPEFTPAQIATMMANATMNQVQLSNLFHSQVSGYGIFTERRVGAQPGVSLPDYLTEWKTLPEGIFIPPDKFTSNYNISVLRGGSTNGMGVLSVDQFRTNAFPFPSETNLPPTTPRTMLPYVAFNSLGQLAYLTASRSVAATGQDEFIPLARGSLLLDAGNTLNLIELPARNHIDNYHVIQVNWLTGRGRIQRPEF